jgi:DNA repair photolyase
MRPVANPPSRFAATCLEWDVPPPPATLQVYEDDSQEILSRNDSPDLGFRWSLNPYRGCFHACAYCYARPSHEYLGLGAGTDFDRRIVVKPRAAELLERAFQAPSWRGELVLFSGNTDCYQPLELAYGLTRACLAVCLRFRNPLAVITKSHLVARDTALLAELAAEAGAAVTFSIPYVEAETARLVEPNAPPPKARLSAMATLARAGVPVGVNIAPVIPGLGDREVPAVLAAAREAGAAWANIIPVRLPGPVEAVFEQRIREAVPLRAEGILNRIRRARGGRLDDPRFGSRFVGQGEEWAATLRLFQVHRARLGFGSSTWDISLGRFRVPTRQVGLFG